MSVGSEVCGAGDAGRSARAGGGRGSVNTQLRASDVLHLGDGQQKF
ncbi:hypothetical protein ACFPM0_13705 [Pseudonocardia sulfidoxydans]